MSKEYALSRVKDALEQSDGNHMKAYRLIMEWLENDNSLYYGLTVPHMKSIVTHAISHVDQKPVKDVQENLRAESPTFADNGDEEIGELGQTILSGMTAKSGSFGEYSATTKPVKASQNHVDALKAMSDAYKKNKE